MRVGIIAAVAGTILAPHVAAAMPGPSSFVPVGKVSPMRVYAADQTVFHGVGVVTAIDARSGVVTIDHKAIPGLMDAMEMAYTASPKTLIEGLKKGDHIEFEIDGKSYAVLSLKKLGAP